MILYIYFLIYLLKKPIKKIETYFNIYEKIIHYKHLYITIMDEVHDYDNLKRMRGRPKKEDKFIKYKDNIYFMNKKNELFIPIINIPVGVWNKDHIDYDSVYSEE